MHTPEAEQALSQGLADVGIPMRALRRAFITHLHPDHMGMAGTLEGARVEVLMHRPEIAAAERVWSKGHERIDATASSFERHGMPRDVDEGMREAWIAMGRRVDPVTALVPADDGEEIDLGGRAERVRGTPGHTDYHAVLVDERDGILLARGHVLPRRPPDVRLCPQSRHEPVRDILDS